MGDAGADTMTSRFLQKKLKIPSAVCLHLMKKQLKINESHTDLESDNDEREWNQTFSFFGDFISAKLSAPTGIGPLRHSHRETIWLAERRGPAQHAESGWTQLSFQIYQTEATQREARRRLRLESEHESWTLREVLHLDDPLGDFQPKTKEAFDRFWLEESRKHKAGNRMSCHGEKIELQYESFLTPACFFCSEQIVKLAQLKVRFQPGAPLRLLGLVVSLSSPSVAVADWRIWDFCTVGKAAVQICLARPFRRVSGERRSAPEGKRKSPQRVRAPLHTLSWTLCCCTSASYTVHGQAVCLRSASSPRRHAAGNKSALLTCGFALRLHTNGRCICQRKRTDYLDERKKKKYQSGEKIGGKNLFHLSWAEVVFDKGQISQRDQKVDANHSKSTKLKSLFHSLLIITHILKSLMCCLNTYALLKLGGKKERQENLIKNVE